MHPAFLPPTPAEILTLSTQWADIYNIPLLIIEEEHMPETNSSLLVQPVPERVGGGQQGSLSAVPLGQAGTLFSLHLPLKVCDFAARIDFPVTEVSAKVKELQ